MRKVIITVAITFLSFSGIAQKFDLQVNGYKPVVYQMDSIPALELFNRARSWADLTYKTPALVDTFNLEEKSITVSGYAVREMKYSMHNYDFKYQIFIKFKDGKYQLNFEVGDMYTSNGDKSYSDYHSFFKKDGSLKYYGETAKISLDTYFNTLADDIYTWITKVPESVLEEEVKEVEEEW